jgi:hypothetical protein
LILSVFGRLEELAHVESSDIAHAKYLRKSSQKWSVLTAARGHQPSQHILLCRSPNIWWRYARRGKRYKPSATFAACATSSASTAARAAQRILRFIEGASTYPKLAESSVENKLSCLIT